MAELHFSESGEDNISNCVYSKPARTFYVALQILYAYSAWKSALFNQFLFISGSSILHYSVNPKPFYAKCYVNDAHPTVIWARLRAISFLNLSL